jgi:hypothetical protein
MFDKYAPQGERRDFYSAYVFNGRGFTSQLVAAFRDHMPVVTAGIRISTKSGEARNAKTGKRVKLWSVRTDEPQGDEATAYVSWYVATLGGAGHTLHLRRNDGKWIVESEKMDWVS